MTRYHIPAGTKVYRRGGVVCPWLAFETTKPATFDATDLVPSPAKIPNAITHCATCNHSETFHYTVFGRQPSRCARVGCACLGFKAMEQVFYFTLPREAAPWVQIAVEAQFVTVSGIHVEPEPVVSQSNGRNHVGACGALGTSADLWSGK